MTKRDLIAANVYTDNRSGEGDFFEEVKEAFLAGCSHKEKEVEQTAIEFAEWKDDNFFQGANGYTKKGWSGYSSYGDGTIKTLFALFIQERGGSK